MPCPGGRQHEALRSGVKNAAARGAESRRHGRDKRGSCSCWQSSGPRQPRLRCRIVDVERLGGDQGCIIRSRSAGSSRSPTARDTGFIVGLIAAIGVVNVVLVLMIRTIGDTVIAGAPTVVAKSALGFVTPPPFLKNRLLLGGHGFTGAKDVDL